MGAFDNLNVPPNPGVELTAEGVRFTVHAPAAASLTLCLFDDDDQETGRHQLHGIGNGLFSGLVAGVEAGARYGLRADGPWQPDQGHRFDKSKLLVDPYATRLDRPFTFDPGLARKGEDTASLVPKAILEPPLPPLNPGRPQFKPGGLIYEVPVRAFTLLHPDVPEADRGTIRALAHPSILDHLCKLHVDAVELMPIAAWIDERHLPPLGLTNAWGYNPVTMLALDPRLAPGGIADLRHAVEALHAAGIAVLLDVVFNHTGESDTEGPTLSLRGLGNAAYYRHDADGNLINDTGCGNTLACDQPMVQGLVLSAMRHFVTQAGIDGFRFDLAPVLGRDANGFSPDARLLQMIVDDPVLHDRVLVAEPWDIGPGGYQLGKFGPPWLEWNDHARDDIRRYWRGDPAMTGALATRLSGSSDIFDKNGATRTRSLNFVAAHDGFPLGDLVAYADKHNQANGENNRDGHDANYAWNNGAEGPSDDPALLAARESDARALIATLFASRGTILLTAGDEFGHSQHGNNNAYAQDNAITWRNWGDLNQGRLEFTRAWAELRAKLPLLRRIQFLQDTDCSNTPDQVSWLTMEGHKMTAAHWEDADRASFMMVLGQPGERLALGFNRGSTDAPCVLPDTAGDWCSAHPGAQPQTSSVSARAVACWQERGAGGSQG
ncbi:glycogen debranching protein GlgX [Hoeflea sp. YIM 152468]|uniref:glycogen debranching protein GlgX n=1 Tax=Hoeflea sp. YIM 152468 TaxID=3031759 RepID=UPI0023DB00B0|nr:glycogen debranching protein GlgX [Hoeflea sp. YIM 152468]MDF1607864.1 glycogen debranching protein GlgX [Hoeflea sp. YIM 152468]